MDDMEGKNYERQNKNLSTLVIILGIVVIALLVYIFIGPYLGFDFASVSKNKDKSGSKADSTSALKMSDKAFYHNNRKDYYEDEDEDDYYEEDDFYDDYELDLDETPAKDIIDSLTDKKMNSAALEVQAITYIGHYEDAFYAKVKNISGKDIIDAYSYLVFFDENNVPSYIIDGDTISYLKNGEIAYLEFFEENYEDLKFSKISVVVGQSYFDDEDEDDQNILSLQNKISFKHSIETDSENDENKVINITGKNNSSEMLTAGFTIVYYDAENILYTTNLYADIEPNSTFSEEDFYETEFWDEVSFPSGYKYDVILDYVMPYEEYEDDYYDDYDDDYDYDDDDEDEYDYDYEDEDDYDFYYKGIGDYSSKNAR